MALPIPILRWAFDEHTYRKLVQTVQRYIHGEAHTHSDLDGSGAFAVTQWTEESNPATPPANSAYTYLRASGSNQQFCIKFDNGAIRVIADNI